VFTAEQAVADGFDFAGRIDGVVPSREIARAIGQEEEELHPVYVKASTPFTTENSNLMMNAFMQVRKEQKIQTPSQTFHYLPQRCGRRECSLCYYSYHYWV
jgi:hypothetical protein